MWQGAKESRARVLHFALWTRWWKRLQTVHARRGVWLDWFPLVQVHAE